MADNQIIDDEWVINQLVKLLESTISNPKDNTTIKLIDLKFNKFFQKAAELILEAVLKNKKCCIELTNRFDDDFNEQYLKHMRKISLKKSKLKKKSK